MNSAQLSASKREISGRKVASLRKAGIIPAVIYGRGFDALSVQVPLGDFEQTYRQSGESTVLTLQLDGSNYPVMIKDVSRDPISDNILHVDFFKVRLDEKITAMIPLEFLGESPAVKSEIGVLIKAMTELQVKGFPQDLPHSIQIDLSTLAEIGDQITLASISIPSILEIDAEPTAIIALIQAPAKEEEIIAKVETSIEDVEVDSGKGIKEKEGETAEEPVEEIAK